VIESITFVLCIENNAIREQSLLLCESIREFGGRYRSAPILAVAPRAGFGIDRTSRERLDRMNVEYVEEPLNQICPEYGSANRVFTAEWAERRVGAGWIAVLDSDTIFLREPELPLNADVAVRPVDIKGSATQGPSDPFEDYWNRLAGLKGLSLDCLPFVQTTVCDQRIRASYNGGLIVVRAERGILGAWADLFSRSVAAGLKPYSGQNLNVRASTGLVGLEASEYWGSNQAAVALAIWSITKDVVHYPDGYNVPLHAMADGIHLTTRFKASPLVHLHYHWLFSEPYYESSLTTMKTLGVGRDHLDWLSERLPLR
jgi:hypothetical protein